MQWKRMMALAIKMNELKEIHIPILIPTWNILFWFHKKITERNPTTVIK